MGILPGLFLFKQPSYLVNPLPPPTDHRRFIIKATRSATSEDSRKDSHGVSSRLPLLLFPTIATLPIEPMSAGEGESSTARTPRHRCVCIFRTIRSRLQGVRSVDHSHEKPLTSRYSERPFHAFQRTFSDPLTVRCVRFRLGVALRYVTLRLVSSCHGRSEVSRKKNRLPEARETIEAARGGVSAARRSDASGPTVG